MGRIYLDTKIRGNRRVSLYYANEQRLKASEFWLFHVFIYSGLCSIYILIEKTEQYTIFIDQNNVV